MSAFVAQHLTHFVAIATLISRLGDIGTTYLVSPTMELEANPIARRLGWKYTYATLALALVPYYSLHGGVIVLTASLLAAASNASEALLARHLGEERYAALNRAAIQTLPVLTGLSLLCLPAFFFAMLGLVVFALSPRPAEGRGRDVAMGVALFATALLILYPLRFFSERRGRAPAAGA